MTGKVVYGVEFRRDTGWKWAVGRGHECGAGSRLARVPQTEVPHLVKAFG